MSGASGPGRRDFRRILERLPGVFWTCDGEGRCDYAGPQLVAYTGRAVGELLDLGWQQAVHPVDWEKLRSAWRAARGSPFRVELRLRRQDGAFRWFEVHGTPDQAGPAPSSWSVAGLDVDDRKALEPALAASEARYRTLFTSMHEGFQLCELVYDAAGRPSDYRFLEVNPGFERTSGLAREAVVGRTVREVLPDIEPEWIELYAGVAETGRAARHEGYARGLDRWFEVYAFSPSRGRFAAVSVDVTDRHRVEQARREAGERLEALAASLQRTNAELAASQERYRLVNQATHDVVWDWDLRDGTLYWNDALGATFGYDREAISRRVDWWYEQLHPDDRDRVSRSIRAVVDDPAAHAWSAEYRFRHVDGRWLDVLDRGYVARDEGGRGVRMIGSMLDLTPQKRAAAALEEAKTRLEVILASLPVGVFITDAQGSIVEANERARAIWGGMRATRDVRDFGTYVGFWPGTQRRVAAEEWALARALTTGETVLGEVVDIERFDGSRGTILNGAAAFRDGTGRVTGAVAVNLDITELRRAEQALRQSEARLRQADRHKDDFLAMLSHELRNPLAPIRNGLHVLERAAPGSEQARRALGVIDRQVQHMTRIVGDLLDVTRISRGKATLQRERLDLDAVVRAAAEDHRGVFERAGVRLEVHGAGEALPVHGDPTRLAQVIGNLLHNAAKFTPRGGATAVHVERAGAGSAVVRVRDDGAGIARQTLAHVFEPFVQADRTLERSRGGIGLGLPLARGLVEMHGGTIEARSEGPGRGSEFVVTLPLAAAGPAVEHRPPRVPGARAPRRRVLLVEDNPDAGDTLREALELWGHEVALARSGPEGVEKVRSFAPDVVLCDIGLPGLDGYGVARAVRAGHGSRPALLVALSGYAQGEDVRRAREAGFDVHLAKPPDLSRLEALLADPAWREPA